MSVTNGVFILTLIAMPIDRAHYSPCTSAHAHNADRHHQQIESYHLHDFRDSDGGV